MDSQEIIKAVAKYYKVKTDKIVKLMTVPDTYQMGTQRFTAVYNDDLNSKATEVLPETIHKVYRELGDANFIRYGRVQLKTTKEIELLRILASYGKDANQFLFGLIKDMSNFLNQASYHVGWSTVFGADDCIQLTVNRMYMQIFILRGQFPPVEDGVEGVSPEPAPAPSITVDLGAMGGGIYATGGFGIQDSSTITFRTSVPVVSPDATAPEDEEIPF